MQNGQTVRVMAGGKPRRFVVAEVLAELDGRDAYSNGRDHNRWHELLIVRTARGSIAIRSSALTRWQNERDQHEWVVYTCESDAAVALARAAGGRSEDCELVTPGLARKALRELEWWDIVADEV